MTYSDAELALIRKYDRPGPRYTSYPTAVEFHDGVGPETYAEHLALASKQVDEPLSLYIHLPFCWERCWYCGCNVVISRKPIAEEHYREILLKEIRMVAERLGERRTLRQLHWGGGTPTYAEPEALATFHKAVLEHFDMTPDAEVAIEVDPRVTTADHIEALAGVGFNRLSAGVQDFDTDVQEAIGRIQTFEQTAGLIAAARTHGFESVNVDLIYGLPKQTVEGFEETIRRVLEIRPDRVAVYGYAHLPQIQRNQRKIDAEDLPSGSAKLAIFNAATDGFEDAGYVPLGMDHFALPEDELARAAIEGRLGRNFMGYTVRNAPDTIACGLSSIGDVAGAFVQNEKHLARYQRAIEGGELATIKGRVRTQDDVVRGAIITELMVNNHLDIRATEARFGLDFATDFADELKDLAPLATDGLVEVTPEAIDVVGLGRRLVRNVAMVFDAYRKQPTERETFSRTV
ncbi:MAG: oxygen-independent coproporphyrinogen III oxidase [Planctomycetota bacterium]|nr:oxygen-independent coproporphyrinogen III oxidase [Planctomycetota bacterium]